jgi:hypothetical protein
VTDFLHDRRVLQLLLEELTSEHVTTLLAPPLRAYCRAAVHAAAGAGSRSANRRDWRNSALAAAVPAPLRAVMRSWRASRPSIQPLVVAFRAFVAARMHRLLGADAGVPLPARDPALYAERARRHDSLRSNGRTAPSMQ